jgi:protocatechuate 3,4-dioxygenase alpha subunit
MSRDPLTPSQTVGPFFAPCLLRADAACSILTTPTTEGARIHITGHVYDGDGAGIPDAIVEIWQANHYGRYNHPVDTRDLPLDPAFRGFGRSGTDAAGAFWFETIKPGPVPFDDQQMQAPHICVAVFARGLLNHLLTRLYFADDPATAADPILAHVPAARRPTLLAQPDGADGYTFDMILQGTGETVFFNL